MATVVLIESIEVEVTVEKGQKDSLEVAIDEGLLRRRVSKKSNVFHVCRMFQKLMSLRRCEA
jgi:hypothetical protein